MLLQTVARSIRLTAADREELRMWHSYTGDEDPPSGRRPDHGSSTAQIRWLDRGLDSQDFGRCDTWSVRTSAVSPIQQSRNSRSSGARNDGYLSTSAFRKS